MEVGKYVGQRGGSQLGVQPVVVEQHVLPQFGVHAALDEVIRQFG